MPKKTLKKRYKVALNIKRKSNLLLPKLASNSNLSDSVFLKQILETTSNHISTIDLRGYYTTWNKASEKMFGYKKEEVIGKLSPKIFHQKPQRAQEIINKALEDGIYQGEAILKRKNKEIFPAWIEVKPLFNKKKEIVGMLGSATDLTEIKKIENRQKNYEEKYIQIFNNSADAIFHTNSKGIITNANQACQEISGYPISAFIGKCVIKLPFVNIRPKHLKLFTKFLSGKEMELFDIEITTKNGEKKIIDVNIHYTHHNGKRYAQAYMRDITERKKSEKTLIQSESMYRGIFEHTGTATMITESDMSISYANSEFIKLSKYKKEEIINKKKWFDFFTKENLAKMKHYHNIRKLNEKHAPRNYETTFKDRHGNEKKVYLTVGMIPETQQKVTSILDLSNQKKLINDLQKAKKLFDDLVESTPNPIFVIDSHHKIIYWNKAMERITGLKAKKMIGTQDHWKPFYKKKTQMMVDMIMSGMDLKEIVRVKENSHFKVNYRQKSIKGSVYLPNFKGQSKWLKIIVKPLNDQHHKMMGAIMSLEDITAQKQMSLSIENRIQELEVLYKISNDFNFKKNTRHLISKTIYHLVNACDEKEKAGATIYFDNKKYSTLKRKEKFLFKISQPIKLFDRTRGNIEMGYIKKPKNTLSAELIHEQKVLKVVADGLSRSIQNQEIFGRYEKLTQKSIVGILIFQDKKIKYTNAKLARFFKMKTKDLINLSQKDFFTFFEKGKIKISSKYLGKTQKLTIKRKDGTKLEIEFQLQEINFRGKTALLGYMQDVTQIKTAENRQKNFNKELKQKISEKTKDLKKANKRLMSINQLKDEFIAIASHELRSPLTSIQGYLSFITDPKILNQLDLAGQKYATRAFYNSKNLNHLVNNILDVSRIETGNLSLSYQETTLRSVIEKALASLNFQIEEKKIKINITSSAEASQKKMCIDGVRIEQVIRNILENAIRYSQPEKNIKISIKNLDNKMVVKIRDEGIGIPKAKIPHLFKKFSRIQSKNNLSNNGSGLGLFIAKKIIESHGGSIKCFSQPHNGSCFTIKLPHKPLNKCQKLKY